LTSDKQQHVFASPLGDQAPNHIVMAVALHGGSRKAKVTTPGICVLLGLKPPFRSDGSDLGRRSQP
jgi:hypothetical protein